MAFSSTTKPALKQRLTKAVSVARRPSSLLAFGLVGLLVGAAIYCFSGMQQVAESDEFTDDQLESDLQMLGAVGVRDSGGSVDADSLAEVQRAEVQNDSEPRRFETQDGVGRPLIVGRFESPDLDHSSHAAHSNRADFGQARVETADATGPLFGAPATSRTDAGSTPSNRAMTGRILPTQYESTSGQSRANGPANAHSATTHSAASRPTTPTAASTARPGQAAWLTGTISID